MTVYNAKRLLKLILNNLGEFKRACRNTHGIYFGAEVCATKDYRTKPLNVYKDEIRTSNVVTNKTVFLYYYGWNWRLRGINECQMIEGNGYGGWKL